MKINVIECCMVEIGKIYRHRTEKKNTIFNHTEDIIRVPIYTYDTHVFYMYYILSGFVTNKWECGCCRIDNNVWDDNG